MDESQSPGSTAVNAVTSNQVKPVLLIRPASSHEDLASGFSFGKAKPPQPLNLGSRDKQAASSAVPEISLQTASTGKGTQINRTTSLPDTVSEVLPKDQSSAGSNEIVNPLKILFTVPFPPLPLPPDTPPSKASPQPSQGNLQNHTGRSVEADNGQDVTRAQVTNQDIDTIGGTVRLHKKKHRHTGTKVHEKVSTWTNAEEDAIHMLMFNREKLLQYCDSMLLTNRAQEEKIASLENVESMLNAKLKDAYQCLDSRDVELREMHTLKPKLQARIRKFKEYLNGLCDEHVQFKDMGQRFLEIAEEARNSHQENVSGLDETKTVLAATQQTIKHERDSWIKAMVDRDQVVKLNEQLCLSLQEQLHQARIECDHEKACTKAFETLVEQEKSERDLLVTTLAYNHKELASSMLQLLDMQNHPKSNDMTPMLQRCVDQLESLQQRQVLGSANVHQLHALIKEETKSILSSVKFSEERSVKHVTISQQMVGQIEDMTRLKALLLRKSKEESNDNVAREELRDKETALLKATMLKKSEEERLENMERQKLRDNEISALKASLVHKAELERHDDLATRKTKDEEIAKLKAALMRKTEDEEVERVARQKANDEAIVKLRASLMKEVENERLNNMASQKAKDEEITRLNASLIEFSEAEGLRKVEFQRAKDNETATHKAKDAEIAELKAALEEAQTSRTKLLKDAKLDSRYAERPVEEDGSQVEEIPRDLTEIMNGTRRAWPHRPSQPWSKTVTSEKVAGLFPRAPARTNEGDLPQEKAVSETFQSLNYRKASKVMEMHEVEDSQPQQSHDRPAPSQTMSPPSHSVVSDLDDLTARNTVTNASRVTPNTEVPRKRTANVADLAEPYGQHQFRKTTRSSTRAHSAVIANSQPQTRPLMMTTTSRKARNSMYQKKFDQYH